MNMPVLEIDILYHGPAAGRGKLRLRTHGLGVQNQIGDHIVITGSIQAGAGPGDEVIRMEFDYPGSSADLQIEVNEENLQKHRAHILPSDPERLFEIIKRYINEVQG